MWSSYSAAVTHHCFTRSRPISNDLATHHTTPIRETQRKYSVFCCVLLSIIGWPTLWRTLRAYVTSNVWANLQWYMSTAALKLKQKMFWITLNETNDNNRLHPRQPRSWHHQCRCRSSNSKQESCAIAKMTARCALCMGALKILTPQNLQGYLTVTTPTFGEIFVRDMSGLSSIVFQYCTGPRTEWVFYICVSLNYIKCSFYINFYSYGHPKTQETF